MSSSRPTIEEQIKALAFLRGYAKDPGYDIVPTDAEKALAKAINTLDNAEVFVALDEARDEREAVNTCTYQVGGSYETPPEYCELEIEDNQEYCPKHRRLSDLDAQLDPAEWGDTTREDMARHQQTDLPDELSTQQAADLLNVSYSYMVGLLESGEVAYVVKGGHRAVFRASLLDYKRKDDAHRRQVADELTRLTLGDDQP